MKQIIIDASNLSRGGGLQVALSFISDVVSLVDEPKIILLVDSEVESWDMIVNNKPGFTLIKIKRTFLYKLKRAIMVKKMQRVHKVKTIFFLFGPIYFRTGALQIVGFANPYIIYSDSVFFQQLSFLKNKLITLRNFVSTVMFKRNSDIIVFETNDASQRFQTDSHIRHCVIPNVINSVFDNVIDQIQPRIHVMDRKFVICYLTSNYPHKNIAILPEIVKAMLAIEHSLNFEIIITIGPGEYVFPDFAKSYIRCIDKVNPTELVNFYSGVDIVLMPSLLEVFSANYVEAFFNGIPLVVSDLPFSRNICGSAALYASPLSSEQYANFLVKLIRDAEYYNSRSNISLNYSKSLPRSIHRTNEYLKLITDNE